LAYRKAEQNMALYGSVTKPEDPDKTRLDYVRNKVNPLYKMDRKEALEYAAGMGMSDTARGIGQAFSSVVGWDEASEWLKSKDDKLRAIFESEEFGREAMINFLGTAVVADPVSYAPIVGWISKGKKAKNLYDMTKYGASSAAIISGASYVPEDLPGLFVDEDSSELLKRAENVVIGGVAGGVITGGGAKLIDKVQIARGKGSIFKGTDEIDGDVLVDANAKDITPETETIKVGSIIQAPDRQNLGEVINIDDNGVAIVQFVNKKSGKIATKKFNVDDLTPPKEGRQKKVKPKVDEKVSRDTETKFIYDSTTDPKQPTYSTGWRNSTFRIVREMNPETKEVVPNSWVVFRDTRYKNPMSDPSGEFPIGPAIKTTELGKFGTLKESKTFVKGNINRKKPDVIKEINNDAREPVIKTREEEVKRIIDDFTDNETGNPPKLKNSILQFYQDNVGIKLKNAMFNNVGETFGGLGGGIYGYKSETDPEATMLEKLGRGIVYSFAGAAAVKGGKFIDGKYNNNGLTELVSRAVISDYGLLPDYLKIRTNYRMSKNKIASEFYDIQKKIGEELSPEQNKLLWSLMSGETRMLDSIDPKLLNLNDEARELITKYAQELSDAGLLNKKTFQKHIKTYLKRSYLKNVKNKQGTLSGSQSKSIQIIGDELRPRGIVDIVNKKAFNKKGSAWQTEGWEVWEDLGKNKLKVRRDYTKQERIDMEEIEDAAYAIAETGRLFSNDVSAVRFFDELAADSRFVVDDIAYKALPDEQKGNFIKMTDVQIKGTNKNKYGKLNGQYVDKDVARDVQAIFNMVDSADNGGKQAIRALNGLNILWKKTKTAWNLGTHVANTNSNIMLMDFADTDIKYLAKAVKEMMKGDNSPLYKDGKIAGIFDANMYVNELAQSGTAMQEAMIKLQKNYSPSGFLGFAGDKLKWAKKYTLDAAEKAYQMEDSVFRLAVYMDRIDKGLSPEQAALDARRWFIDYDINAPLIQALKKTVLPFVSYTYRIAPLLAEAAVMRPHKFAKWSAYGYVVNEASQAIMGEDDEVARLTMRDNDSKQMFGVPFLSSSTLRLPMNSAAGDPMFLDVSRWIPGGDIFEQKDTSTAIPLLPAPLQPGGIWYDVGYTLATKTDPFTGQPIKGILPDDGGIEQFGKLLANYLSKQAPNMPFVPGSYAENKRKKAIRVQERGTDGELTARGSRYTSEYSPFEAIAYGAGIKLRPQNINVGERVKKFEYTKIIEELNKARKQIIRDYSNDNIDIEDRDKQIEKIEESIIQVSAEYEIWERKLREARDKERTKKFGGGEVDVESAIDKPEQRKSKYLNGEPFQTETLTESLTRRRFNRGNIVEEVTEEAGNVFTPEQLAQQELEYKKTDADLNRNKVLNYLRDKGIPKNAIIGLMANIDAETGLEELGWKGSFDYLQQQTDGPGKGLWMLDPGGDHVKQYDSFLKRSNRADSTEAQLDYTLESIYDTKSPALKSNGFGNARDLRALFKTGTPEEIAEAFAIKWERPKKIIQGTEEERQEELNQRRYRATRLKDTLKDMFYE
jgi:hypothetical protein